MQKGQLNRKDKIIHFAKCIYGIKYVKKVLLNYYININLLNLYFYRS